MLAKCKEQCKIKSQCMWEYTLGEDNQPLGPNGWPLPVACSYSASEEEGIAIIDVDTQLVINHS